MQLDPHFPAPLKQMIKAQRISSVWANNRFSKTPVTGSADVDVSITSYGSRLGIVPYAIESLAMGALRPRRMILWISDDSFDPQSLPMLNRLVARGLEIRRTEDLGPHKKWYPYAVGEAGGEQRALVVADDDILYPSNWLEGLVEGHTSLTNVVVGYRAHAMEITDSGDVEPYSRWGVGSPEDEASHRLFVTSGAGTVIPPSLLSEMASHGMSFMEYTPRADDIWLNVSAIRANLPRKVLPNDHIRCVSFPRSQATALHHDNVTGGGNDQQLASTLTQQDRHTLAQ
ncbi:hypothetical protein [Falsarthrobacter nasiphocae]|uniref:Glycosyltransferase n=1 Tax=Falsarthrobacter nasiphocae TaxID=189863 RepID=A0AAE3YG78_9MICC|nr:hypothetical protein [Falsarthrobacter nasiphocae]MDR6891590.1 hypothetical protein [Falsarthrobacter nasiphocae]